MQRCPKCGYREGIDWPAMLWVMAFGLLYVIFLFIGIYVPRSYRLAGPAAFLLFLAGSAWRELRNRRDSREFSRLHPSVAERVKSHLKPNLPANSWKVTLAEESMKQWQE